MRFKIFLLSCFLAGALHAQNGTAIQVNGTFSVCPGVYQYNISVLANNVCYIAVTSNGGHKVTCGVPHPDGGEHPTFDIGEYISSDRKTPLPQGQLTPFCIHWVSSGAKSLCFTVYSCEGDTLSNFCLTITNPPSSFPIQGNTYVCNGQWAYFTVPSGLTGYAWSVVPDNNETYSLSGGGCVANIGNLNPNSWHVVSAQAVNCWGTTLYASKSFWTTSCLNNPGDVAERGAGDPGAERTDPDIRIYPNPVEAGQPLLLRVEQADVAVQTYELYNLDGKLLKNGHLPGDAAVYQLDMPEIPGVYLLILRDANHRQSRHKVVVGQ